jgi:hypothetical protein
MGLRGERPATNRMSYGVVMSKFRDRIQNKIHEITLLQLEKVEKEMANVKQKILVTLKPINLKSSTLTRHAMYV